MVVRVVPRRLELALLLAVFGAACAAPRAARDHAIPPSDSATLVVLGHSDLGGAGLNGAVAVVGTTAIVGAGITPAAGVHTHMYNPYACPAVAVKLVDLSDASRPRVAATVPVPPGVAAIDVAALRVRTPTFTGDLAAIALAQCNSAGATVERGVVYYDVTRPDEPRFLGRYHADADSIHPPSVPPCGAPPAGSGRRCASSQHSVALVQRADGRVLSISTEPGASASRFPSGDVRVVDVTDPRAPRQVAAFPPAGRPIFASNGCRPFSAAHDARPSADGRRVYAAYFDDGVLGVDVGDAGQVESERRVFRYPETRDVEGNAAYLATTVIDGRDVVVLADEDWIPSSVTVDIAAPAHLAGRVAACEAIFSLFDPARRAQLYRQPDGRVSGELVYVGRGCPANPGLGGHAGTASADAYLADPRGRIALIDRTRQATTQPELTGGSACSTLEAMARARAQGAVAVVIAQTVATAPLAFSFDGDPRGLAGRPETLHGAIPVVQIDKATGDALRATLCPSLADGRCAPGTPVRVTLRSAAGEWGGVRVIDASPAPSRPALHYLTRRARAYPPPDLGVYSAGRVVARADRAYVAWNSDGVRVLDIGAEPKEIGHFVPPDRDDPTGTLPSKAYVVGVALTDRGEIVISDVHSGLYVLRPPPISNARTGPVVP